MLSFNMVRLDLSLSGEYPSCRVLPFNRDPPLDVPWVSIPKLTVLVVSRALNEENQVTMHVHASVVASYCIPALTLNYGWFCRENCLKMRTKPKAGVSEEILDWLSFWAELRIFFL